MECNREEAIRAKEISEKKMQTKDFVGARKFVIKAQQLYPKLENISQMLTVCEVHCSAEQKVGSNMDWYGILQIEPTADDASIRKQYRKLALLLHPDKNKFPGAEAAFKLAGEAHTLLLDPAKRNIYDITRGASVRAASQKQYKPQPSSNVNARKQPGANANPVNTGAARFPNMKPHQQKQQQQTEPGFSTGQQTFWTACPFCKNTRYQYNRIHVNKTVSCPMCKQPFIACDVDAPGMARGGNNQSFSQKKEAPHQDGHKMRPEKGGVSEVGGDCKPKGKENTNSHMEDEKGGKEMPSEHKASGNNNGKRGRNSKNKESCPKRSKGSESPKTTKAQSEPSMKGESVKTADFKEDKKADKQKGSAPLDENFSNRNDKAEECKNSEKEAAGPDEVRHASFYDFVLDKNEECFSVGQMWAMYDHFDGMPRFYARIRKVHLPGFKVRITWLEVDSEDQDVIDWTTEDLPVACGKFKHLKTEETEELSMFSHRVDWVKITGKCPYRIYPRKGETWALFKNWDINWCFDPDNHRNYEYEFVEVTSDYTEESGINVAHLAKIKGFVSLFKPTETSVKVSFQIPPNELLRFSHRVPSYRTTGEEREDVPEGYFELDPASLPSNIEEISDPVDVKVNVKGSSKCSAEERHHMPKASDERIPNECREKKPSEENAGQPTEKTSIGSDNVKSHDGLDAKDSVGDQISSSPSNEDPSEIPEAKFYNFEDDKSHDKFQPGQIWSLYCDFDALPKNYAQIKKVLLAPTFKLDIEWLEACAPPKSIIQWLDKKMPICCGTFKSGEKGEFQYTVSFSHLTTGASAGKKNKYEIYPRKGEVWALYKNFDSSFSHSDLNKCEYEIVEVLDENGRMIKVLVLGQIAGFETVFRGKKKAGLECYMEIRRAELLRFSHRVPAFRLTEERDGKLRGCWELDPKALPVYFFSDN